VIDKGYYENILIKYDVVVQASTQQEFREAVSDYRNAIVSQLGYQRLTDKYHPEEYRLAMYDSGFDENPSFHGSNAVFTLKFNCKPQRFLIDGEDEVAITSGDTLTNPTLYEAHPLIVAEGTGGINIGDQFIQLSQGTLEDVTLAQEASASNKTGSTATCTVTINDALLNTGDDIYSRARISLEFKITDGTKFTGERCSTYPSIMQLFNYSPEAKSSTWQFIWPQMTFKKGTAASGSDSGEMVFATSRQSALYISFSSTYAYDGADTITYTLTMTDPNNGHVGVSDRVVTVYQTTGYSTRLTVTDPIYIDLDIGEAYTSVDGQVVSVNNLVKLGSDLPVLYPGANEITTWNTITSLKITPRWWQL
jgi:phage-related protein